MGEQRQKAASERIEYTQRVDDDGYCVCSTTTVRVHWVRCCNHNTYARKLHISFRWSVSHKVLFHATSLCLCEFQECAAKFSRLHPFVVSNEKRRTLRSADLISIHKHKAGCNIICVVYFHVAETSEPYMSLHRDECSRFIAETHYKAEIRKDFSDVHHSVKKSKHDLCRLH